MLATGETCDVRIDRGGPATIVAVSGEVDLFGGPRLAAALEDAASRGRPVVVDLTGCTFFDSSGLYALLTADLEARRTAAPRPGLVFAADSLVARQLEVSAPGHFAGHETLADALASL